MTSHDSRDLAGTRDNEVPAVERVIELALTLPVAIGARLVGAAPAGIERARQQIVLARFVGKLAVDRGAREVLERLGGTEPPSAENESLNAESEVVSPANQSSKREAVEESPGVETLALPDYDQLPAAHVIAKLSSLSEGEREALEMYEVAHRHRRTVLGKLAQLRSDEEGV